MQRPVIAVDFDDVLMPFYQGLIASYNKKHSGNVQYEDLLTYYLEDIAKCDPALVGELITDFFASPEHAAMAPLEGVREALEELKTSYALDIVTSRPESARVYTEAWIERNFPGVFREKYFINSFFVNTLLTDGTKAKTTKSMACKQIGAQVLIDDHLHHATDVADSGIPVLLPDRPWNRTLTHPLITRVHSWDEIVAWVKKNL